MYSHTLVIGGTGMLRAASMILAHRSKILTSVARTRRSLNTLGRDLSVDGMEHLTLQLDWRAPEHFLEGIEHHIGQTGCPDLVVAWIHDDALTLRVATRLAEACPMRRFYHVIGSATENPLKIADSIRTSTAIDTPGNYHQVVLGRHLEGGRGRWLTHQEISQGVLEAIERQDTRYVVGTL